MMRKVCPAFAVLVLCALVTVSCQKEKTVADYIATIDVSLAQSNALRVKVSVGFHRDCDFSVTYWRHDAPEEAATTLVRSSEGGRGEVTLLFLYPETKYEFKVNIEGERHMSSPEYDFETASLPTAVPTYEVTVDEGQSIPGYVFQTDISSDKGFITIADTDGNIVWYQPVDETARMFDLQLDKGRIWMFTGFLTGSTGMFQRMVKTITAIDLYGNVLHRWSISDGQIPGLEYPHHEIREMPDGRVAVVSNFIKNYDLTPIGGEPDTPIWGDGYAIFTQEGKVLKTWDVFEELGPLEDCDYVYPLEDDIDLVHANSFNWDSQGNYYMTFNHSSQLWKIDSKTGKVIYRVGPKGNTELDPDGFASGLHAAVPLAPDRVLCLDNGSDIRQPRAIIYKVDPASMKADVELSVRLPKGYNANNRSNVELIQDGSMLMFGLTGARAVVFTDLQGNIKKVLKRECMSYRAGYIKELPKF